LSEVPKLRASLESQDLPHAMVTFEQRQRAVPETTLNQKYRPAIGGLQIFTQGLANPCTLGFNVLWKAEDGQSYDLSQGRFFLTASHCSPTWGVPASWNFFQHTAVTGNKVGVQVDVAPKLYGAACPPNKSPCQHADVLVVRYDDTVSTQYLRVANVDASKNITGAYNLQGAYTVGGLDGETVTKVGSASGKTTGTISATCIDVTLFDAITNEYITLLCEQRANYTSAPFDSGAPVFIPYSSTNWNTPRLVGIHSSSDGTNRYFAPMSQVDYALNYKYFWY
jgi:hypothetical protein